MDVKTGSGHSCPTETIIRLAESIVDVTADEQRCRHLGHGSTAGPLASNALEVRNALIALNGSSGRPAELCIALSAHDSLGGRARSVAQGTKMAREALAKGDAAKRFREIIRMQGGRERVMDDSAILPKATHVQAVKSAISGFVTRCDAKRMGLASNALGAGRHRVDDAIDPAVGIYLLKKVGDKVTRGEPLCEVHWNDESRLRDALPLIKEAYEIKSRAAKPRPLIHRVFSG
jgi:thymidine phosphorylase